MKQNSFSQIRRAVLKTTAVLGVSLLVGLQASASYAESYHLLNVSYDPTRELYADRSEERRCRERV